MPISTSVKSGMTLSGQQSVSTAGISGSRHRARAPAIAKQIAQRLRRRTIHDRLNVVKRAIGMRRTDHGADRCSGRDRGCPSAVSSDRARRNKRRHHPPPRSSDAGSSQAADRRPDKTGSGRVSSSSATGSEKPHAPVHRAPRNPTAADELSAPGVVRPGRTEIPRASRAGRRPVFRTRRQAASGCRCPSRRCRCSVWLSEGSRAAPRNSCAIDQHGGTARHAPRARHSCSCAADWSTSQAFTSVWNRKTPRCSRGSGRNLNPFRCRA